MGKICEKKIKVINMTTGEMSIMGSIKDVSNLTGVSKTSICLNAKGARKLRSLYKFEYYNGW